MSFLGRRKSHSPMDGLLASQSSSQEPKSSEKKKSERLRKPLSRVSLSSSRTNNKENLFRLSIGELGRGSATPSKGRLGRRLSLPNNIIKNRDGSHANENNEANASQDSDLAVMDTDLQTINNKKTSTASPSQEEKNVRSLDVELDKDELLCVIQTKNKQIDEQAEELATLNEKVLKIEGGLREIEKERKSLTEVVEKLDSEKTTLAEQLELREKNLKELTARSVKDNEKLHTASSNINVVEDLVTGTDLDHRRLEYNVLAEKFEHLSNEKELVVGELLSCQQKIQSLEEAKERWVEERARLVEKSKTDLLDAQARHRKELDHKTKRVFDLEAQLQKEKEANFQFSGRVLDVFDKSENTPTQQITDPNPTLGSSNNDDLNEEIDTLRTELEEKDLEIEHLVSEIAAIEEAATEIAQSFDQQLEENQQAHRDELATLSGKYEEKMHKLRRQKAEKEEISAGLEIQIQNKVKELADLQTSFQTRLASLNDFAVSAIAQVGVALKEKQENIVVLEAEVERLQSEMDDTEKTQTEMAQKHASAVQEIEQSRQTAITNLEKERAQVEMKEKSIQLLVKSNLDQKSELVRLQAEHDEMVTGFSAEIIDHQNQVDLQKQEIEQIRGDLFQQRQESSNDKQQIALLAEQLENERQMNQSLKDRVDQSEKRGDEEAHERLSEMQCRLQAKEQELECANAIIDQVRDELAISKTHQRQTEEHIMDELAKKTSTIAIMQKQHADEVGRLRASLVGSRSVIAELESAESQKVAKLKELEKTASLVSSLRRNLASRQSKSPEVEKAQETISTLDAKVERQERDIVLLREELLSERLEHKQIREQETISADGTIQTLQAEPESQRKDPKDQQNNELQAHKIEIEKLKEQHKEAVQNLKQDLLWHTETEIIFEDAEDDAPCLGDQDATVSMLEDKITEQAITIAMLKREVEFYMRALMIQVTEKVPVDASKVSFESSYLCAMDEVLEKDVRIASLEALVMQIHMENQFLLGGSSDNLHLNDIPNKAGFEMSSKLISDLKRTTRELNETRLHLKMETSKREQAAALSSDLELLVVDEQANRGCQEEIRNHLEQEMVRLRTKLDEAGVSLNQEQNLRLSLESKYVAMESKCEFEDEAKSEVYNRQLDRLETELSVKEGQLEAAHETIENLMHEVEVTNKEKEENLKHFKNEEMLASQHRAQYEAAKEEIERLKAARSPYKTPIRANCSLVRDWAPRDLSNIVHDGHQQQEAVVGREAFGATPRIVSSVPAVKIFDWGDEDDSDDDVDTLLSE